MTADSARSATAHVRLHAVAPPASGALGRLSAGGQVARFATIGLVSTLAYVAIYALLRLVVTAAVANALALVVTAVGNTAANRRITFGVSGSDRLVRHQVAGLVALGLALGITTVSIGLLHAVAAQPSRLAEIMVLVLANAVATALRFLVLRRVINPPDRPASLAAARVRA